MTTETSNQSVDTDETKTQETPAAPEKKTAPEGETAEQKLARLEAELTQTQELLSKVRRFEKENKTAAQKAAEAKEALEKQLQAEVDKRTALEERVRGKAVDSALEKALVEAKVKAPATALKLLDKSKVGFENDEVDAKTVAALIDELKKSDPILFEAEGEEPANPRHPPVKKAQEGETVGGYEKEIAAATSAREIEAVLRKYGKMA